MSSYLETFSIGEFNMIDKECKFYQGSPKHIYLWRQWTGEFVSSSIYEHVRFHRDEMWILFTGWDYATYVRIVRNVYICN